MYLAIIILSLLGSIVSGFFGRKLGSRKAINYSLRCLVDAILKFTLGVIKIIWQDFTFHNIYTSLIKRVISILFLLFLRNVLGLGKIVNYILILWFILGIYQLFTKSSSLQQFLTKFCANIGNNQIVNVIFYTFICIFIFFWGFPLFDVIIFWLYILPFGSGEMPSGEGTPAGGSGGSGMPPSGGSGMPPWYNPDSGKVHLPDPGIGDNEDRGNNEPLRGIVFFDSVKFEQHKSVLHDLDRYYTERMNSRAHSYYDYTCSEMLRWNRSFNRDYQRCFFAIKQMAAVRANSVENIDEIHKWSNIACDPMSLQINRDNLDALSQYKGKWYKYGK